jgi:hypothetical protein
MRKVAMSACTQCHGQGGFSYRRQNGASAFAVCTNCRGHRFIDDDVLPPPPSPSQLPPWPAPRRNDRISIAGRWLTIGGCLDIWPSGRMNLAREWGYRLGLTGQGIALWNGGAVGILLRGKPLGGRGYFLRFSSDNLITGFCAIRRGPRLPLTFERDESEPDALRPQERRRSLMSLLRTIDRSDLRHAKSEQRAAGNQRRAEPGQRNSAPKS